jgi:two-component system, OmpR family, alkaline phosphatase synthesis response regulator PhoP
MLLSMNSVRFNRIFIIRITLVSAIEIYTFSNFILDTQRGVLTKNNQEISINAQEYRLLEFLVNNAGKVMDRNQILDVVWGYDNESTSRTIDVHIAKLRNKLEESEIPKHIFTVRGRGYRFDF